MFNLISKIVKFIELDGENFKDKVLVWKSKIILIIFKFFSFFFSFGELHLGRFLNKDVIAKNSYGKFYCRKKDEDLTIISEIVEPKTLEIFKRLAKNSKLVIDVGSHIGKYTILAGKISKKVISFEPQKYNFEILKKNIKLNNLKNVIALNFGVFNKNKRLKLYKSNTSGRYSIKIKDKEYEVVNCVRLDIILNKFKINEVDLIKIDVEGAEKEALLSLGYYLKKRKIRNIIIEILPQNLRWIKKFIENCGYSIENIEKNNYLISVCK